MLGVRTTRNNPSDAGGVEGTGVGDVSFSSGIFTSMRHNLGMVGEASSGLYIIVTLAV